MVSEKLSIYGKTQQGEAYEDRGSKRSPNFLNKAAKTWPKPHFCGLRVATQAKWSHLRGYSSSFGDIPLSGSGFPVSAPEFDKTAFDL